jgi:formylglycine-generating enzyme required for sulfatase activity
MRKIVLVCLVACATAIIVNCSSGGGSGTPFKGSIPNITMVSIPGGTFQMGDTNSSIRGGIPVHQVMVGSFTMSQTLVTQNQYDSVIGNNPSYFQIGGTHPVEQVTWEDAVRFCNKLSNLSGLDSVYSYARGIVDTDLVINYHQNGYRLPTEAEYEFACRAGNDSNDYYWGRNYPPLTNADTLAIDSNAVWVGDASDTTQQVALKKPNAYGLYDMSGNVWEWCNDWYSDYADSSQTNPVGPASPTTKYGPVRVTRGGSWAIPASNLSSAYRSSTDPGEAINTIGFRVVIGVR